MSDEIRKDPSTLNTACRGYTVQARYSRDGAKEICGQTFTDSWSEVRFERGRTGVPISSPGDHAINVSGLLSYQSAEAMRWWFLANAAAQFNHMCLETRIIEHAVRLECTSTPVRVIQELMSALAPKETA